MTGSPADRPRRQRDRPRAQADMFAAVAAHGTFVGRARAAASAAQPAADRRRAGAIVDDVAPDLRS